jgi:hypothetical protein
MSFFAVRFLNYLFCIHEMKGNVRFKILLKLSHRSCKTGLKFEFSLLKFGTHILIVIGVSYEIWN